MLEQSADPTLSFAYLIISLIAAVAVIIASFLMLSLRRKFGSGILAAGFRTIAIGVFCISAGIGIAAIRNLLQLNEPILILLLTIAKYALLVIGTFIIVSGSKNTGDKLESMTK